jgi:hypothetical protein
VADRSKCALLYDPYIGFTADRCPSQFRVCVGAESDLAYSCWDSGKIAAMAVRVNDAADLAALWQMDFDFTLCGFQVGISG